MPRLQPPAKLSYCYFVRMRCIYTEGSIRKQRPQQLVENTATKSFPDKLLSPRSDLLAGHPRCARRCIHAAAGASAESAAASASTCSNARDRRFLRRRLAANPRSLELETPQQQRPLASKAAAATATASVGGTFDRSERAGQARQLHAGRGYYGSLGLLADAASNKQPSFDDASSQRWCVPPLADVCVCTLSTTGERVDHLTRCTAQVGWLRRSQVSLDRNLHPRQTLSCAAIGPVRAQSSSGGSGSRGRTPAPC